MFRLLLSKQRYEKTEYSSSFQQYSIESEVYPDKRMESGEYFWKEVWYSRIFGNIIS